MRRPSRTASVRFGYGVRLVWRGPWPLLRTDAPEHAVAGLLGGLTGLRAGERLRLVVSVRPAGRVRGPQPRPTSAKNPGALERVGFGRPPIASDELRAIRTKLAGPLLRVRLVIAAEAGSRGRAEHLARPGIDGAALASVGARSSRRAAAQPRSSASRSG